MLNVQFYDGNLDCEHWENLYNLPPCHTRAGSSGVQETKLMSCRQITPGFATFQILSALMSRSAADSPQADPLLAIQRSRLEARYSKHIIRDMLCKCSLK